MTYDPKRNHKPKSDIECLKAWCHWKRLELSRSIADVDELDFVKSIEDTIAKVNNYKARYENIKKEHMSTIKNRIAIILDRSTSMAVIHKEAVAMFNEQIRTIKEKNEDMDTRVSLFTFSTVADEPTVFNAPVTELLELSETDYIPRGWTAMYDGIGMAIDRLSALPEASDKDCAFLVMIITDGEENQSKKYTGYTIADRIKLLQATGKWTFTFMGANVDVEKMSKSLNILKGNATAFTPTMDGMLSAASMNSSAIASYLNTRTIGAHAPSELYGQGNTVSITTTNMNEKE